MATAELPRVLIIDDDDISREVLAMMLEIHGYPVQGAESGSEAIELLDAAAAHADTMMPEYVLMDSQMPGLSGLELLHALRDKTPARIVAISGTDPGPELRAEADDFLLKPVEMEALFAALRSSSHLSDAEGSAAPDTLALAAAAEDATPPPVDPGILAKLHTMMSASAVREIYDAVAADLTTRLATLETAADAQNTAEVRRIAHAIKGGAAMVGLTGAAEAAARLERDGAAESCQKELIQLHRSLFCLRDMLQNGLL